MSEFQTPLLASKQWVDAKLKRPDNQNCELCFGNLFIWSTVYDNLIIEQDGFFIVKNHEEHANRYSFPMGEGNIKNAIEFILNDAALQGRKCELFGLTLAQQTQLEALFPSAFSFSKNRDSFDYIYNIETLTKLSGKKLHSKRNHITNFKRMHPDWQYEPLNQDNAQECLLMHLDWIKKNEELGTTEDEQAYKIELAATKRALSNFDDLGFVGGLLRIEGKVIAYTFGEAINDTIFCTHIEKAFSGIRGAYPMINQQFAINSLGDYQFVNREEDVGVEGLRKAKLSYRPTLLLEKILAVYGG